MDGGTDSPALHRRLTGTMVAGDQQKDPIAAGECLLKSTVDRAPRSVQVHPMEVDRAVRLDVAAAQLLVPASVQGLVGDRDPGYAT